MSKKHHVGGLSEVDFLQTPTVSGDITRVGAIYHVDAPWALAHFGNLNLKRGWWQLQRAGSDCATEVRLASPLNPLVVIQGGAGNGIIRLEEGEYQVRLLISPWPGAYSFSDLRLKRLGQAETTLVLGQAAARLVRRKGAAEILVRAARQIVAGQALGLKTARAMQSTPRDEPIAGSVENHSPSSYKIIAADGLKIRLGDGDLLHRDALRLAKAEFLRRPEIKALFCDFIAGGVLTPQPQWDPSLARCGAFAETPSFFTADANETTLQCIADQHGDAAIARIPLPLVKRSSAGVRFSRPPRLSDPTCLPLVSAIIPTKYRMDLLEKCLTGLATKTDYPNLEIVVVDNGVTNETFMGLIEKASRSFVVRVVEDKGAFNFSRLMNTGVSASRGEIVLSLNDDVEAMDRGWLHQMAGSAMQPHAGAVGARLIYPDGSIQHAGVVLGLGGTCAHLWRGLDPELAMSNPYIMSPSNRMAVTGACLAVRRSAFDRIRGFDEAFPVAYNDIDFCLRLHEAGLQNFYRGDVCLIHHEGQSRGADDATVSKRRRQSIEAAKFFERWADLLDKDPNFSPAFDATREIGIAHDANYVAPADYTLSLRA